MRLSIIILCFFISFLSLAQADSNSSLATQIEYSQDGEVESQSQFFSYSNNNGSQELYINGEKVDMPWYLSSMGPIVTLMSTAFIILGVMSLVGVIFFGMGALFFVVLSIFGLIAALIWSPVLVPLALGILGFVFLLRFLKKNQQQNLQKRA